LPAKYELIDGFPLTSLKQTHDSVLAVITEVVYLAFGCHVFVDAVSRTSRPLGTYPDGTPTPYVFLSASHDIPITFHKAYIAGIINSRKMSLRISTMSWS